MVILLFAVGAFGYSGVSVCLCVCVHACVKENYKEMCMCV